MSHVGEVRESDHINCKHWNQEINLTARRQGNLWTIWRSDTGQTVPNVPNLETKWVDLESTYWPDVHVVWSGNRFTIKLKDGSPYNEDSTVLNYVGHDAREAWQCYWDPNQNQGTGGFRHTCIRIA